MKELFIVFASLARCSGESILFDSQTHVPVPSAGCTGSASKYYPTGNTTAASIHVAGRQWYYRVKVPTSYDGKSPKPIILQHPGWGLSALQEANGCGIDLYADSKDFISVTATGGDDNHRWWGGPWYSWNTVGSTLSPGPDGPTCTKAGSNPTYCYDSCASENKCPHSLQCSWTTCFDTGATSSGSGYLPVSGFIPTLYDTLETQLCIDTTREFAAGESNGGMMTYQLGAVESRRLAAIAPQFGSFHRGFALPPKDELPFLDIHGSKDRTVPANTSLSHDGYLWTTTAEIFALWEPVNGGDGTYRQYVTPWDGHRSTYCIQSSNGKSVRCMWDGGHNWFLNKPRANGGLVTDFLLQWANPSHVGFGNQLGEAFERPRVIPDNISIHSAEEVDGWEAADIKRVLDNGMLALTILPPLQAHYGDPRSAIGCRSDEDAVEVGALGVACAPRVDDSLEQVQCTKVTDCAYIGGNSSCLIDPSRPGPYFCSGPGLPVPACALGDVTSPVSGCPTDAPVSVFSKAWPVCLGKGLESQGYSHGDFHCFLSCPLTAPNRDLHCPVGAMCYSGELRHLPRGICGYPAKSVIEKTTPLSI